MQQPFTLLITLFKPLLKLLVPALIVITTLISGCGSSIPTIKPFKMDIQQGNVVTSKMLLQLKPGMTKSQVRFIMGTPLVVDSFHKDRWDYFYQMRQAGKIVEQRRVILDFEKELLTKVRGDVVPQGALGAANGGADTGDANVVRAPITVEPRPKETSMLDKLKFWKKDEKVVGQPILAAAAVSDAKQQDAKPKLQDKSLLEQLKFWKKDEMAITAAKAEPEASSSNLPIEALPDAPAVEAPSILAVPIELPSVELPSTQQPVVQETDVLQSNVQAPSVETTKEPLNSDSSELTKTPSITGKDSLKPIKSPSQKLLPAKPEAVKPTPAKPTAPSAVFDKAQSPKPTLPDSQLSRPLKPLPLPVNKDEQLIFRLDKNFDISRADEAKAIAPPASVLPADVMHKLDNQSNPQKADLEPLPLESEPSFFDKMLEKIGF